MFAIRAIMKERPYTVILISLIITSCIFSMQLQMFDGPISEASNQNFNSFWNCIWCVLITLATTGYGDIYPKTQMGRITAMVICFWGMFIVSYFVVTLTNQLNFSDQEHKAYILLERLHHKEQLKIKAANVLRSSYLNKQAGKDNPEDKSKRLRAIRIYRMHSIEFQHQSRKCRSYQEQITDIDTLQKYIERVDSEMIDLSEEFKETQSQLDSILKKIEIVRYPHKNKELLEQLKRQRILQHFPHLASG